tara:strand:- start:323 stop:520 length:198 start_codon:yes stop_codon:yes gene_type:complete
MKKFVEMLVKLAMPMAISYIKENEKLLAKKFADSKDIPFIGEKGEEVLASGVIALLVEFLGDIKK